MAKTILYPAIEKKIEVLKDLEISLERKKVLQPLIEFIDTKKDNNELIRLNFICTHNSRRSQIAQIWAKAAATHYNIPVQCFSGGTEVTAFNDNAIQSMARAGFNITTETGKNPKVSISFSENQPPLECYSKLYDHRENPSETFAAVMTCSHADENCPVIPGAAARIPLDYMDPKEFDNTKFAAQKYDERRDQIGSEMLYVFKQIK